ncbi:MAG TPA: ABC transporter permease [Bryobacteraceae bacterium]|nr:ABC transporter permease [Bryobacteraceae bacterium]
MNELLRRLQYIVNRKQYEQDLADEMRLHRDLVAQTADRSFGNAAQIQEASRAVWIWPFLETLAQDTRYAWRTLRASPGFAATAVLSLALGIGANTAIFSILNAVMLRSLPVADPGQLVEVQSQHDSFLTNPIWEQVRDHQQAFSGALAYSGTRFDLASGGESHFAQGLWVSGDFFHVLGVPAMRGRVFTTDDDRRGSGHAGPVAVISYGFWKAHFAGDPDVLGKTVRLDRHPFTIIGVTPPWFTGLDVDTHYDVAIPIGCEPILHTDRSNLDARSTWWLRILGRLKPDESIQQATAKMRALAPEVDRATLPNWDADGQREYLQRSFELVPAAAGFSETGNDYRKALFTLMAVVGLVLLIACANIANLLLARAAARQREISIRMAIGAARRRVMRQLLSESLLLSVLGAAGGLLFAVWGSRLLVHLLSKASNELQFDTAPDWRVLAFTMGIALLTGLLFGLAPAMRATRVSPNEVLKEHGRGTAGGRSALGRALVTGQVALSLMLLVGAGLFLGTFRNLLNTNLGFTSHNVLLVEAAVMQANVPPKQRPALYRQIVERLRTIPGVAAASSSALTPISGSFWNNNVTPEGYRSKGKEDVLVYFNRVSPGFFETMRIPLVLGRDFTEHDDLGAPRVMIINETAAHRFFGKHSPLSKTIGVPGDKPGKQDIYQVIGVVKDSKYGWVAEAMRPLGYFACAQDDSPWPGLDFEIRSGESMATLVPSVRGAFEEVNRGISLEFRNFETQIGESLIQPRIVALLSAFFGGLAVLLAMIGLYGVTSYGVARRQSEIGIRMALGAQPASVVWLVLRDVAAMLALGTVLGLGASLAAGRLVASLLYGVKPDDAAPLALAAVVLAIATGIAAYLPARRAARLDPMAALREE